ncbi:MAG: PIN domain-containing protein [Gammaproteobacteria bacterium]
MAALDTNVLVRYLVEDDVSHSAAAKRLIRSAVRNNETLFVPVTVALELEWVLRSRFGFAKSEVVLALSRLLSSVELSFGSEAAVEVALALYQRSAADFSDCVHVALAHSAGQTPFWTFDKAAAKMTGTRLLRT